MDLRALACVSWGKWVAQCPRCGSGDIYGVDPDTRKLGGLTRDAFACPECSLVCPADWPANASDIWYVLSLRPDVTTRNWYPGEALEDLLAENIEHGVLPPEVVTAVEAGVSGVLMSSADGRLSAGPALAGRALLAISGGV